MERVGFSVDEGVATLTLREPPANCYSYEMMQALDAAILRARMDESVHVMVIRGEGDKFFCADGDINDQVRAYAQKFAPPNKPAGAVGSIKRAVISGLDTTLANGLAIERELQQQLFISDDAKEGIGAYLDKRTPNFKGR